LNPTGFTCPARDQAVDILLDDSDGNDFLCVMNRPAKDVLGTIFF
jgi:hypothetical protein